MRASLQQEARVLVPQLLLAGAGLAGARSVGGGGTRRGVGPLVRRRRAGASRCVYAPLASAPPAAAGDVKMGIGCPSPACPSGEGGLSGPRGGRWCAAATG